MSHDTNLDHAREPLRRCLARYRVTSGDGFDLSRFAPDDLPEGMPGKKESEAVLAAQVKRLGALQERLYANATWSLLVIFQAMDAAGKDSTIKHVTSGVNPQGISVISFKAPGPHELAHDFLWRVSAALPARGMIGVFNRSHYEEVLVARVHRAVLEAAGLPPVLAGRDTIWEERIADIAAYEAYLGRQGTRILKVFLNVSRDEQRKRFLARLDTPEKNWKFNAKDIEERAFWSDYQAAYAAAIAGTATPDAPWLVVPADRKWFARIVVAEAIVAALEGLDLSTPDISPTERAALDEARAALDG